MKLIKVYKNILFEKSDNDIYYDFFEKYNNVLYNIFSSLKEKKLFKYRKINPNIYKKALSEFVKYGTFIRFPEKYIFQWKDIMITNTAMLQVLTELYGHSSYFPHEDFYDFFDIPEEEQNNDFYEDYQKLESYGIDDYIPTFSNGQDLMSDYGLNPLLKLTYEIIKTEKPEEIIVIINKMLDVSHQRSDLAEIFIEGGSKSLDFISNDTQLQESELKLNKIFLNLIKKKSR